MKKSLYEGRFLRLVDHDGWEYVERTNAHSIVAVIAVTHQGDLVLVEQYRPPVGARVIELPAGLVGDVSDDESILTAAQRELEEETGFRAQSFRSVFKGPISAGLSTEMLTYVEAQGVERVAEGGGVGGEDIEVHLIPLRDAHAWLKTQSTLVDPKVLSALVLIAEQ